MIKDKSGYGKDDQSDNHRRHRGVHHVADMGEKRRVRGRRGEHRRVGKGRNLVAEVCPRNNGSRRPSGRETQGFADAHQGDADCGDGRPRTSGHDRDNGADDTARGQEEGRT